MKTTQISNSDDIIDSGDIIARIEELEEERQSLLDNITELQEFDEGEDGQELQSLKNVAEQGEGYGDWQYGETLIRESYFEDYCQELCKDIGDIPKELPWYIANYIDWSGVACEIKMDYTEIDFDGVTYLMR